MKTTIKNGKIELTKIEKIEQKESFEIRDIFLLREKTIKENTLWKDNNTYLGYSEKKLPLIEGIILPFEDSGRHIPKGLKYSDYFPIFITNNLDDFYNNRMKYIRNMEYTRKHLTGYYIRKDFFIKIQYHILTKKRNLFDMDPGIDDLIERGKTEGIQIFENQEKFDLYYKNKTNIGLTHDQISTIEFDHISELWDGRPY